MDTPVLGRARQLLTQAVTLRSQVREDLRLQAFDADDLRMNAYNDLVNTGADLFPDDPVLNGGMVLMPDGNLEWKSQFDPLNVPFDLATKRLEARLTQFMNRLELVLGESVPESKPSLTARKVLASQRSKEIRAVLGDIDQLLRRQPKPAPVEARDFGFIANPQLRQVLRLDFEEAQRAFAAGAFKASALLAGSIIEGMLLNKLQQPEIVACPAYEQAVANFHHVGSDINWDRVTLQKLIQAAGELGLLSESAIRLAPGARDFRNTIHPNAELREGIRAQAEEAKLLLALVELIYRDLARQG